MMRNELRTIETLTAADALTLTSHLKRRKTKEIVVEISHDQCGYRAKCLAENIVTQAETWEGLRANIRKAIQACSLDHYCPGKIQLHLVRDETLILR
jgi:hypothetical protein